jgi:2-methylfumaryl-CoA hydratase
MSKTEAGNFFEDFAVGQKIRHATPRTLTEGDRALYQAIFGPRFALASAETFARSLGYERQPLDDLLLFHVVFGKTVPDISLNAVANLGYANCIFARPAYAGDTVTTESEVIGLREASNRQAGVVYVRSVGVNQDGETLLDYVRWVLVNKRDPASKAPPIQVPELPASVDPGRFRAPPGFDAAAYDWRLAGGDHAWDDYQVGERIDHVDGMTLEEAEHQMATRLYQNTAKVHFDLHQAKGGRFGRRIVYGGHVISLARALSFNGLANAQSLAAINGGRHVNPCFAGDTVYAWSEVLDKIALEGRDDLAVLRLRSVATKDLPCREFPYKDRSGAYLGSVLLDLDYWVFVPRQATA